MTEGDTVVNFIHLRDYDFGVWLRGACHRYEGNMLSGLFLYLSIFRFLTLRFLGRVQQGVNVSPTFKITLITVFLEYLIL